MDLCFDFDAYSSPFLGIPDTHTENFENYATPSAMSFGESHLGSSSTSQATPSTIPNEEPNNASSMQRGHSTLAASELQGGDVGHCVG